MPRLEAIYQGALLLDIIVDANEGWNAETFAELAPDLLRLWVKLVEQPFPAENDEALLEVERPVPICADESYHDRTRLSKLTSKYDMVNIKLDKTGGLSEAILLRDEECRLVMGSWSALRWGVPLRWHLQPWFHRVRWSQTLTAHSYWQKTTIYLWFTMNKAYTHQKQHFGDRSEI